MKKPFITILLVVFAVFGCTGNEVKKDSPVQQVRVNENKPQIEEKIQPKAKEITSMDFQVIGPVIEEKTLKTIEVPASQFHIIGPVEVAKKPSSPAVQFAKETKTEEINLISHVKESAREYVTEIRQNGDKIQGMYRLVPWKGLKISEINNLLGVNPLQYRKYLNKAKNRNYFVLEGVPIEIPFEITTAQQIISVQNTEFQVIGPVESASASDSQIAAIHPTDLLEYVKPQSARIYVAEIRQNGNKIHGKYCLVPWKGLNIKEINNLLGVEASQYQKYLVKSKNGNFFVKEGKPIEIRFELVANSKPAAVLSQPLNRRNKASPKKPLGEKTLSQKGGG